MNRADDDNEQFQSVRCQLDALGYRQYVSPDCVGLVGQLVSDLLQTTHSLKQYKTIAQKRDEIARSLEAKATPFVRDNCSLIQECNELQAKLQRSNDNEKGERRSVWFVCLNVCLHLPCLPPNYLGSATLS